MKQRFLYGCVVSMLFIFSCKETGTSDPVPADPKDTVRPISAVIDWGSLKKIDEQEVFKMAALYDSSFASKSDNIIRQINMDGPVFMALLQDQKRLKLISALASGTDKPTVIIQRDEGGAYVYYDIHEFFKSDQPGMDGQEPVCPGDGPIQDPLKAGVPGLLMPDDQVKEMSDLYITRVKEDPNHFMIRQILIDAYSAQVMYAGRMGLKLVMATGKTDTNSTVLMQTWTGSEYFYGDIRNLFIKGMSGIGASPLPLCPPPDLCDLP